MNRGAPPDIQPVANFESVDALREWNAENPHRFLISDGHFTFSITKTEAMHRGFLPFEESEVQVHFVKNIY